MSRFNTGNPLGSGDSRDLDDNAKNMDLAVNSEELSWSDRFGRDRKSFEGMEREFADDQSRRESEFEADQAVRENEFDSAQNSREVRFNDFIVSSGYQFLGDYGPGIEITEYNQLVRDANGEFWRLSGQVELPYTTTGAGIPEDDALVPAGDAVLRQDLANPDKGAAMVARGAITADSVADLMALPEGRRKLDAQYIVKGAVFSWNGTNFVQETPIPLEAFGAVGDGLTDCTDQVSSAAQSGFKPIVGRGVYLATGLTELPHDTFIGTGEIRLGSSRSLYLSDANNRVALRTFGQSPGNGIFIFGSPDGIEEWPEDTPPFAVLMAGGMQGEYRHKLKKAANLSASYGWKHTLEGLATQFFGISKHALQDNDRELTFTATGTPGEGFDYPKYFHNPEDLRVYWPHRSDGNRKTLGVDFTVELGPDLVEPLPGSLMDRTGYQSAVIKPITPLPAGTEVIVTTIGCSHVGAIGGAGQFFWGNYQGHCGGRVIEYSAEATDASGIGGRGCVIKGSASGLVSGIGVTLSGSYSANLSGDTVTVAGNYSCGMGYQTTITADARYAWASGNRSLVEGYYSSAVGDRGHAYARHQHVLGAGLFFTEGGVGENQHSTFLLSREATSSTTILASDGGAARPAMPDNTAWSITGQVIGLRSDGLGCSYELRGFAKRLNGVVTSHITAVVMHSESEGFGLSPSINTSGLLTLVGQKPDTTMKMRWGATVNVREVRTPA